MLLKKLIMLVLIVQQAKFAANLSGLIPNGNYGDILFITDVYQGVQYSYHKKIIHKNNFVYNNELENTILDCMPKEINLYEYLQGEIQFSSVKKYSINDHNYQKFIDLGQQNNNVNINVNASCESEVLSIYVYKPGRNIEQLSISIQKQQTSWELGIFKKPYEQLQSNQIMRFDQTAAESLKQIDLLFIYKFNLFQAKSVFVSGLLDDKHEIKYDGIVVPKSKSFTSDYRIIGNKIQAIYIAQENYLKENKSDPSSNIFSKDQNMINPISFLFQLDIDERGIFVRIQRIQIGNDGNIEYNHFKSCHVQFTIQEGSRDSKMAITYMLEQGEFQNSYNKTVEIKSQISFQDVQYAYSDVPFKMEKSQCAITFQIAQKKNELPNLQIKLHQPSQNHKEYKITKKEIDNNLTQINEVTPFDQNLNNLLDNIKNLSSKIEIEKNALSYTSNGNKIICQKIFDTENVNISNEDKKIIKNLSLYDFNNQKAQYHPQYLLQWNGTNEKKTSYLYYKQGYSHVAAIHSEMKQCQILSLKNNSATIAIKQTDRQTLKIKQTIKNQNKIHIEIVNQRNIPIFNCQTEVLEQLPSKYNIYYQYMVPTSEPEYLDFYGVVLDDSKESIVYYEDQINMSEGKACFIDQTVLKTQNYIEVVFYEKPSTPEEKFHYVKAYFENNQIKVFEVQPKDGKQVIQTFVSATYTQKDYLFVGRNFDQETKSPDSWHQSKFSGIIQENIYNQLAKFSRVLYFDNKVQDLDQTYKAEFYQKDNDGNIFFLVAVIKKSNPVLGNVIQNSSNTYKYWLVQIFEQGKVMNMTLHDLCKTTGSSIVKDKMVSLKSVAISYNDIYTFSTRNQQNEDLKTYNTSIKITQHPIVILFLPTTSYKPYNITVTDTSMDKGAQIISTQLMFREINKII